MPTGTRSTPLLKQPQVEDMDIEEVEVITSQDATNALVKPQNQLGTISDLP